MFKKLKCIILCGVAASLVLTSCGNKADNDKKEISKTESSVDNSTNGSSSVVNTVIKVPEKGGSTKHISITQQKVTIYSVDAESDKIQAKNSMITIKEELIPQDIIDAVLFELDDLIDGDTIANTLTDKDSITIDFVTKDKDYPFGKKSQVTDVVVLDCISYSIFDNFKDYKKIYFKLNGEAFRSKQLKLSDTKPFMINE